MIPEAADKNGIHLIGDRLCRRLRKGIKDVAILVCDEGTALWARFAQGRPDDCKFIVPADLIALRLRAHRSGMSLAIPFRMRPGGPTLQFCV